MNQRLNITTLSLRSLLGVILVAHGLLKFLVFTLAGTAGFFASVGFPGWTAYIVAPAELLLGAALILGLKTRWAALASIPILLGALSVHMGNGWLFSNANGGWEFPATLVALAAIVATIGGGQWALWREAQ